MKLLVVACLGLLAISTNAEADAEQMRISQLGLEKSPSIDAVKSVSELSDQNDYERKTRHATNQMSYGSNAVRTTAAVVKTQLPGYDNSGSSNNDGSVSRTVAVVRRQFPVSDLDQSSYYGQGGSSYSGLGGSMYSGGGSSYSGLGGSMYSAGGSSYSGLGGSMYSGGGSSYSGLGGSMYSGGGSSYSGLGGSVSSGGGSQYSGGSQYTGLGGSVSSGAGSQYTGLGGSMYTGLGSSMNSGVGSQYSGLGGSVYSGIGSQYSGSAGSISSAGGSQYTGLPGSTYSGVGSQYSGFGGQYLCGQRIQCPMQPIYAPRRIIELPPIIKPPRIINSPPIVNPPKVINMPPIVQPPRVIVPPPIYKPAPVIQPPPIYKPPQVINSPPIIRPPQIIQPPPIIKQPRVIESPPIYKPPRVIESPPIYKPPQVIQSPPIIKPPQVIQSPPIIRPPQVIQSPPIIKPPQVIQSPPIYKPPRVIESPPIYKPPRVIESPPIIKPPQIISSPPIIQPPQVIKSPPIIQPPQIIRSPPIIQPPQIIRSPPIYGPPLIIPSPVIPQPSPVCPACGNGCADEITGGGSCLSHSQCGGDDRCCYTNPAGGFQCTNAGSAYNGFTNNRYYRAIQNSSAVGKTATLDLFFGNWTDSNVLSLMTYYILPIKVDFIDQLDIAIWTYNSTQRNNLKCSIHDINCMSSRMLSCIMETEPLSNATTESIVSTADDKDLLPGRRMLPSGEEGVKILSFSACVMETMSSKGPGKDNVLIGLKRCVRSHRFNWQEVRACVAHDTLQSEVNQDEGITEEDAEIAFEMTVNNKQVEATNNMALSLCLSLNVEGITPTICELLYDELEGESITEDNGYQSDYEEEDFLQDLGSYVVDVMKDAHNLETNNLDATNVPEID